ncbi:MAG: PhoH family protein [Clostridiales bacterium]|jgi:phosphate starvation-inducible PhoH-like protein|nr:PhoH family protein [Clostridiales bacterium]
MTQKLDCKSDHDLLQKKCIVLNPGISPLLFGSVDQNLFTICQLCDVDIKTDSQGIIVSSKHELTSAILLIEQLVNLISQNVEIDKSIILQVFECIQRGEQCKVSEMLNTVVAQTPKGKKIIAKTRGQNIYVQSIFKNTLVFGIGPAGCGKTYLAVATAITAKKKREIDKIILTRPAIEAGEKLGFLPGDMQQKVDPYLRPIYDALEEMTGEQSYLKLIERGNLEIAPLAYMRGRTLSKAFIILDEAQNTTESQMKMFLTRFGQGSKVVVTGDLTQIDLPKGIKSGLTTAISVLKGIEDISIVHLHSADIVRHHLVQKIVDAYALQNNL